MAFDFSYTPDLTLRNHYKLNSVSRQNRIIFPHSIQCSCTMLTLSLVWCKALTRPSSYPTTKKQPKNNTCLTTVNIEIPYTRRRCLLRPKNRNQNIKYYMLDNSRKNVISYRALFTHWNIFGALSMSERNMNWDNNAV